VGLGVCVEELDDIEMRGAVDRIAADTDASGLADVFDGELVNRFVGQSAGAGNHADVTFLVNVTRGDTDAAAAGGVGAITGSHYAGAVRTEEAGFATGHGAFYADHVFDRDAFGDGDSEIETGIDTFKYGVSGERRRHEDRGNSRASGGRGFFDGVENGDFNIAMFEELTALAGSDSSDNGGTVIEGEAGVATAEGTGDALDYDLGGGSDENGHFILSVSRDQSGVGWLWFALVNQQRVVVGVCDAGHLANAGIHGLHDELDVGFAKFGDGGFEVFDFEGHGAACGAGLPIGVLADGEGGSTDIEFSPAGAVTLWHREVEFETESLLVEFQAAVKIADGIDRVSYFFYSNAHGD